MADIAENEPLEVVSGTTVKFKRIFDDYKPENSWVLTYTFINKDVKRTVTTSDNGDSYHLFNSTLTGWVEGRYSWQAFVAKSGERYLVDSGEWEVKADYALHKKLDTRSHVKKVLDALEAMIENKASKDQLSYSIATPEGGSRTLSRLTHAEVIESHKYYKTLYQRELDKQRRLAGKPNQNVTKVAFRRSS